MRLRPRRPSNESYREHKAGQDVNSLPIRAEIEKAANDAFSLARDRIQLDFAGKLERVLDRAGQTGNIGAYLPAITAWAADLVREMVLSLADAWVDAFNAHGMACDVAAEMNLEQAAHRIVSDAIATVRGHPSVQHDPGLYLANSRIERSMRLALNQGLVRMHRQRIKAERSAPAGDK